MKEISGERETSTKSAVAQVQREGENNKKKKERTNPQVRVSPGAEQVVKLVGINDWYPDSTGYTVKILPTCARCRRGTVIV